MRSDKRNAAPLFNEPLLSVGNGDIFSILTGEKRGMCCSTALDTPHSAL